MRRSLVSGLFALAVVLVMHGCDRALPASEGEGEAETRVEAPSAVPDARLVTHAFEPSTPTRAGLEYIEQVAAAHERADEAATDQTRVEILAAALELDPPPASAEAEVLRLELAARLCETQLALGEPEDARDLLAAMLAPKRSLPLDRASAHALTVLGDAAQATGDDALAAGSYARAVRMMSLLADDLAEKAGVGDQHRVEGGAP